MTDPANISPQINDQAVVFDRDAEHIKILSICWYVVSGLAALGGFFSFIYIAMGIAMVSGAMGGGSPPPPAAMGYIFIVFGVCFSLFIWTIAILGLLTARNLTRYQRIYLCYVAAALVCLQIPIGTTLGVFTFIVLSRPSIRSRFV